MSQMVEVAPKAAEADHTTILIQARVEQGRAFWRAPSTTPAREPVGRSEEEIRESRNSNHLEIVRNDGEPRGDFLVSLREFEEDSIRKVLAATGNNKTLATKFEYLSNSPSSPLKKERDRPE
jgi:hypothetical protein